MEWLPVLASTLLGTVAVSRIRRRFGLPLALVLLMPSLGSAQTLQSFQDLALRINVDDRLRIEDPSGATATGRLTRLTREEITIETSAGEKRFTSATVRTITVRRGSRSKGVLIGAGIGAATGALLACTGQEREECADGAILLGALGAGIGLAVSALVPRATTVYRASKDMSPSPGAAQGLAMYVEVCGLGPSSSLPTGGWEHSGVTIERDGRISATTGASPHGQGNETTFAQMLADQFGVPIDHVTILHGDTGIVKQGIGTFGSRSQAVGGTALHLAGGKVKAKMAKFAAALMEANEADLVFEGGRIFVKGAPASGKSFAEVAAYAYVPVPLPPGLEPGLSDEAFFEPANNTYPFGCHISMLEIDRDTGEPKLLKLVAVDDAGNLINPLIVEGQIHGGLAQGIGQAMIEEVVYNSDGQLVTGSFMDYAIPRATDRARSCRVMRVSPVENRKASTRRWRRARACANCTSIRE
jgi:hypothetical protein